MSLTTKALVQESGRRVTYFKYKCSGSICFSNMKEMQMQKIVITLLQIKMNKFTQ